MRIRQYLDARLDQDPDAAIIVLGDLDDGPGQDLFEQRYLAHNVTDLLIGSPYHPETLFNHALIEVPDDRFTAVFDDFVTNEVNKRLLLDHILLSPGLRGSGAIRHAEYDAQVVDGGLRRQDRPCDHRPVTVDLTY